MSHTNLARLTRVAMAALVAVTLDPLVALAQSSSPATASSPLYREVTDETGRTVRLPQQIHRIITLSPNLTEIVYALGLQDELVGNTTYCDYPPEAQKKTKVGDTINPSIEEIATLHPDIVLVTKGNRLETVYALEKLGIPSYGTDPHTIEEIAASTKRLGEILGAGEAAAAVVADFHHRLADVQQHVAAVPMARVLFVVWTEPLISISKDTFIADALRYAGATSIVDSTAPWPRMNLEEVVKLQPDFLVFPDSRSGQGPHTFETMADLPGWRLLNAVRNHKIAVVNEVIDRPAPRIVTAIEELARQLHPEAFLERPPDSTDKEKEKGQPENVNPPQSLKQDLHSVPTPPAELSLLIPPKELVPCAR
ncbi:MAG TPA: helical backbone metal receptor [Candidatus Saccharimonadales bacterium]|nr:helical backbone metal receptor [Candidatus Saccharimonadales bacterium]